MKYLANEIPLYLLYNPQPVIGQKIINKTQRTHSKNFFIFSTPFFFYCRKLLRQFCVSPAIIISFHLYGFQITKLLKIISFVNRFPVIKKLSKYFKIRQKKPPF